MLLDSLIVWRRDSVKVVEVLGEVGGPAAIVFGHDAPLRLLRPLCSIFLSVSFFSLCSLVRWANRGKMTRRIYGSGATILSFGGGRLKRVQVERGRLAIARQNDGSKKEVCMSSQKRREGKRGETRNDRMTVGRGTAEGDREWNLFGWGCERKS